MFRKQVIPDFRGNIWYEKCFDPELQHNMQNLSKLHIEPH